MTYLLLATELTKDKHFGGSKTVGGQNGANMDTLNCRQTASKMAIFSILFIFKVYPV
jgi:hypothetical protein